MENVIRVTNNQPTGTHRVVIDSREKVTMTGVEKVDSASDSQVNLHAAKTKVTILGSGLLVNKFDVESGNLEVVGKINGVRYNEPAKGLLKRLVK